MTIFITFELVLFSSGSSNTTGALRSSSAAGSFAEMITVSPSVIISYLAVSSFKSSTLILSHIAARAEISTSMKSIRSAGEHFTSMISKCSSMIAPSLFACESPINLTGISATWAHRVLTLAASS